MADEQNKEQTSSGLEFGAHVAQNMSKAGNTVKNVAEAAAKASVGDVAGAVVAVLKDENVRKAIIAVILIFGFLFMGCAMLIGTAITGTVEYIARNLAANWEEAWEEAGINSNGNTLYLYTIGALGAGADAILTTIAGAIESLFVTTDKVQDNHDDRTAVSQDDYRTFLNSVSDKDALTGEAGAMKKCLEMIKGRVAQRGEQLAAQATTGYALEALGNSLGVQIQAMITSPFLYYGVNSTSITVDTSAFEWTDIQALKILGAYAIQHDCVISDIDMWDLMEYCGWYSGGYSTLDTSALGDQSIYNGSASGSFRDEIAEVVTPGQSIDSYGISLAPPPVTKWEGNFVPQWYNEQISALLAHNKKVQKLEENGDDVSDMIVFETDAEGHIVVENFEKLAAVQPYGIIDRIYTSANATLKVTRTEYEGASQYLGEYAAKFTDALLQSIKAAWDDAAPIMGPVDKTTDAGNKVARLEDGTHSFSTTNTVADHYYYLINLDTGLRHSADDTRCYSTGATLSWNNLEATTNYALMEYWTEVWYEAVEVPDPTDPSDPTEPEEPTPTIPEDPDGPIAVPFATESDVSPMAASEPIEAVPLAVEYVRHEDHYGPNQVDTFTTFDPAKEYNAFQLNMDLNITYAAVSADQLIMNVMGLWPGSLYARETDESTGIQYAEGYLGNELLQYNWTDKYTDPVTGEVTTLEFTRCQAFQVETYKDIVLAIADMMGISTVGLFGSNGAGGSSIVAVAKAESEYYNANGLSGGMRYWDMARNAGGTSINYNAAWCVCFVLTCAWQCGYIGPGEAWGDFGGGEWIFYCDGIYNYLCNNGFATGHTSSDYEPVPGDLIFFNDTTAASGMEHIGIVVEVADDGVITYIDGNTGGGEGTLIGPPDYHKASSYAIGTVAYTDGYICAYANPYYPVGYISEPVYLTIEGSVQPSASARRITLSGISKVISGIGRLRQSQLVDALGILKDRYPELYTDDLLTAATNGDMTTFMSKWNAIASGGKAEAFKFAQGVIRDTLVTDPIARSVKAETGFDWQKTEFRENLLWGIVTTSDQPDQVVDLLADLCSGMSNSIGDSSFLDKMAADEGGNTMLHNTLVSHRNEVWPDDTTEYQNAWIQSIDDLLAELKTIYNNTAGAIGDPDSSVEAQIFHYLTNAMGLPASSACGILANIYHESSFNPNCVGDSGTSYGLCQWHNDRYDALISYCDSNGLDYRTVLGQMRYLQYELETQYSGMLAQFRAMPNSAQGAYDAGAIWCKEFERPANADQKAVIRGNEARDTYWPRYNGG